MRKINYLLIGILMIMAANAFCQTTYLLTFSAKDKNNSTVIALDKVYIKNETTGKEITTTDTFLFLDLLTGISENSRDVNSFSISQNFENVKDFQSSFNVTLPTKSQLVIKVYDITAKEVCKYNRTFDKGIHTFGIKFETNGIFIISANNGDETKTLKAYNNGIGNANAGRITLIGSEYNSFDPVKKTRGSIKFTLGDQMRYVGYTSVFKNDTINDSPTGDMDYVFEFSNSPPSAPANPIPADGSIDQLVNTSLSWSPSSDYEGDPLTYDIYFGTSSNPIRVDSNNTDTIYAPGTLDSSTIYYWKIVTKDDHDNITTGSIWEFTTPFTPSSCGSNFLDVRDSHTYKTVEIGTQCWMAENLAYLPSVRSSDNNKSSTIAYFYVNGYEGTSVASAKATNNYQTYGVWYNWPAAMDGEGSSIYNPSGVQGVCPTGWHLPSNAEMEELINHLGGGTVAGGKLKEAGTLHWFSPNTGADNSSGFSGLPGGSSFLGPGFSEIGNDAFFWTTTEVGNFAYFLPLRHGSSEAIMEDVYKQIAFSVRCVRD